MLVRITKHSKTQRWKVALATENALENQSSNAFESKFFTMPRITFLVAKIGFRF